MTTEDLEGERGVPEVPRGLNSDLCEHCIYYTKGMIGRFGSLFEIKGLRCDQIAACTAWNPFGGHRGEVKAEDQD